MAYRACSGERHAALKGDGASTAAGIRQKLKHGALAIVMNELEPKTDQGATRVRLLIEQMRTAYSDGTGQDNVHSLCSAGYRK